MTDDNILKGRGTVKKIEVDQIDLAAYTFSIVILEDLAVLSSMFPPYTCGYLGGAASVAQGRAAQAGHEGRDQLHSTATLDAFISIEMIPLQLRVKR